MAAANGNVLAVEHSRRTFHSLGSTTPADQLLPQILWEVVAMLLHDGRLSAEQERALLCWSPLLHEGLRPSLTAALPASIHDFLEALLRVSLADTCLNTIGLMIRLSTCLDDMQVDPRP